MQHSEFLSYLNSCLSNSNIPGEKQKELLYHKTVVESFYLKKIMTVVRTLYLKRKMKDEESDDNWTFRRDSVNLLKVFCLNIEKIDVFYSNHYENEVELS